MSKKCANPGRNAISRNPSTSSDNSDYRSLGSDWAYPSSEDDEWSHSGSSISAGIHRQSPFSGRALIDRKGSFGVGLNSSPAPYVTMSRGQSSRMRTPDAESAPTTPSRPRVQTGTPSTVKKRSQHFESSTKATDPRSPFSPPRRLDQLTAPLGVASSSSGPSISARINLSAWNSGLDKNLFPNKSVAPTPTETLSSASAARPMPVWTVVVSDSENETESEQETDTTDAESEESPSPLNSRRIFTSQSTIPSNTTSLTSFGSQSSLTQGKSTSTVSSPVTESPVSDPAPTRALRKRDSPLPVRGKPSPNTPSASRLLNHSPPTTQTDAFTQPPPVATRSKSSGPSTPKSSASVPDPTTPSLQSISRAPRTARPAASAPQPTSPSRATTRASPPPLRPTASAPEPAAAPQRQPPTDDPAAVDAFLQRDLCRDLDYYVIAHDKEVQARFDELRIEWGIQFQLARGQSNGLWTWEKVGEVLEQLKGTNEEMGPRVLGIMLPDKAANATDSKVWAEFDREQAAIMENEGRGLGLMGDWMGVADWYGGRIQQLARLTKKENGGGLKLTLEPLEKRRSHRLARFLGSHRVLQIRVPEKLAQEFQNEVREFFARRFILLGRTFVPFHVKDGSVYMVEVGFDFERVAGDWCGDQYRLGFIDFMEWHNPMSLNFRQAISKFVTRFALILSNTVPVIEFNAKNMIFIKDIDSSDWPLDKPKTPTEKIMTDGCGFINVAALTIVTRMMGYESAPTALQGRIDGSKGLWVRHPTDESDEPKIWIRESQNKIKNPRLDRAHRIFELVGPSKASTSVALSTQSILNLHFNGVPSETIIELFREGLKDEVTPLLQWDSPALLYHSVAAAGGVAGARLARIADGHGRALGVQRAQWRPDEVEENPDESEKELDSATYTGRNPYSGAPHSIHESLIEMIQAGFSPARCHQVQTKLKQVIKNVVDSAVEKYRIPLDGSIAAWLVPDPLALNPSASDWKPGKVRRDDLGLLKEGEIYFKSSQPLKDEREMAYHVITGDVVIGRYPMRLPSDLQKVKAVDIPEYALYTDVVIVSVNGDASLPSLLSGGDMDGDIVNIFRDPELVRQFSNKPLTEPPADLMAANFQKEVYSVVAFCTQAANKSSANAMLWYFEFILKDVVTPQKGLYSMFHDCSVATLGYDHPQTIRLAYIFNAMLDASKTGLRLKEGIFDKDKKDYGRKPDPFGILADLRVEGKKIFDEFMVLFEETASKASGGKDVSRFKDPDLLKPYQAAIDLVHSLQEHGLRTGERADQRDKRVMTGQFIHDELRTIHKHVDAAKDEFMARFGKRMIREQQESGFGFASPSKAKASKPSYGSSKSDQADEMYRPAKMFSDPIEGVQMYQSNIEEIKASYAVYSQSASSAFPWSVAFKGLCTIKAKAKGIAPAVREIDECKGVSSSVAKVLAKTNAVTF